MKIFDEIKRTYKGPAEYNEPSFCYVNRSERDHFKNVRRIIEEWFDIYKKMHPEDSDDLRKKIRSKKDNVHISALTELYCHNLLMSNGYDVEIHPNIPNSLKRPDFLASKNGKPEFYLEATAIYGNKKNILIEKYENLILDQINFINSPDFLISVTFKKSDYKNPPPLGKIRKNIEKKINDHYYEDVCKTYKKTKKLPEWYFKRKDWEIKLVISPVKHSSREKRNEDSRIIGAISHPMKSINLDDHLKKGLLNKAKRYGELNIPFIISANIINNKEFYDEYSVMSALFGKETIEITSYDDGSQTTKIGRNKDGLFINPKIGVTYTRVSGVLIIPGLFISTIEVVKPILWSHPKGKKPLKEKILDIEHKVYNPKTDKMENI